MAFNVSKKHPNSESESDRYGSAEPASKSYLGKTLEIKGEITSDEILTVEGKIIGNINISKTLNIGKNGFVDGEIKAEIVKIEGRAEGDIQASTKLHISSKGVFSGTIKSDKLVIEEGAVFQGKANMEEK